MHIVWEGEQDYILSAVLKKIGLLGAVATAPAAPAPMTLLCLSFPPLIPNPSLTPSAVDPPVITDQPVSLALVVPGQSATFTVTATGDNLLYQWQKDGSNITSGANSATYTIAAVVESDEGAYQCVVTNAANSVTSTAASLTVCKRVSASQVTVLLAFAIHSIPSLPPSLPPSAVDPPTITGQPDPQLLIVPGQRATFTVTAMGDSLVYQWQRGGSNISSGVNSATYTIVAVAESDEGAYQCIVTNAANSVTSTAACLTVCKCIASD